MIDNGALRSTLTRIPGHRCHGRTTGRLPPGADGARRRPHADRPRHGSRARQVVRDRAPGAEELYPRPPFVTIESPAVGTFLDPRDGRPGTEPARSSTAGPARAGRGHRGAGRGVGAPARVPPLIYLAPAHEAPLMLMALPAEPAEKLAILDDAPLVIDLHHDGLCALIRASAKGSPTVITDDDPVPVVQTEILSGVGDPIGGPMRRAPCVARLRPLPRRASVRPSRLRGTRTRTRRRTYR